VSENYKAAYSLLFPKAEVCNEPFLYRVFSPSVAQADRAATRAIYSSIPKHSFTSEELDNVAGNTVGYMEAPEFLQPHLFACVRKLQEYEPALFECPTLIPCKSMKEEVEQRDYFRACAKMHANTEVSIKTWAATVIAAFSEVCTTPLPHQEEGIFIGEVPILTFWKGREVGMLWHAWFVEETFHKPLKDKLWRNLCNLNGTDPLHAQKLQPPAYFLEKDISTARTLFANTPLWDFLNIPVPVHLPQRVRFEHMHLLGGSGAGKTKTFEQFIANDLVDVIQDNATVVVIEPDGALIERLSKLAIWTQFPDKLTIIDPRDVENPIALNMFDVNMERLRTYSPLVREQTINGVIELFDYVFGSLLASELTGKQSTLFRYVVRLMLSIPGANIQTLRQIFEPEGFKQYEPYAQTLTGAASHFFRTEWNAQEFRQTKSQILRRIWQLLENSTFERMFSHERSRFDLTKEINEGGRLILINTAQDLLKQQGSELFGRLFIALITGAALERAAIPEHKRTPTFVYIDEAAPFVDANIETILTQARKYKIGLVLTHQHLGQLQPNIKQTLASNTAIKMAGGVSHADATAMSRDMRCEPDYIDRMRKGEFATYIKGVTSTAVKFKCDFGVLDRIPAMSPEEYQAIKNEMRLRYCAPPAIPPPHAPPVTDEDLKPQEW
jgi:hypothetical protein